MNGFVLNKTGFVLNMSGFVLNMTGLVLSMTGFVLNLTEFVLNMAGFVLNMTGHLELSIKKEVQSKNYNSDFKSWVIPNQRDTRFNPLFVQSGAFHV